MAAIEAAEHGAAVLVLERERHTGGSTRLSGGFVALCETELQPGTRAELLDDLVESHHHDADHRLSELYVHDAPDMYERLAELGIRFATTKQFAHMSRAWGHELPTGGMSGGAQIVETLEGAARERSVEIVTSARARRLFRDSSGAVVALEVVRDGQTGTVEAGKAVILGTGGFTRNQSLIKNFGRPGTEKIFPLTGSGSHGDGLVMAMDLGAATAYLGVGVAPTGPVEPTTGKGSLVNYSGGILVNKEGRRFCDESAGYLDISWAGLTQTDTTMVQIFDERIHTSYMADMVGQTLSGWKAQKDESLPEVLRAVDRDCSLDVAAAYETVAAYNRSVDAGEDPDFGRRNLIGTSGDLVKIECPPFYALITVPGTTHFNGGLRVETDMRVLDLFGEPIGRLYAAGEVIGGFHGAGYLSATCVGSALIFGRRAGRLAVT
jgi:fumarate reductase flavoprotein subunit